MSVVLGIGGYTHDSAAALVVDGQLVSAVQEERLTRVKHVGGFPHKSIEFCLGEAGLTISDVDALAFYTSRKHWRRMGTSALKSALRNPSQAATMLPRIARRFLWNGYRAVAFEAELKRFLATYKIPAKKFHAYDHHLCHAAATFYSSPHDEMAILCVDAVGDGKTTSFWLGNSSGVKEVAPPVQHPHAIAMVYSLITKYLGFRSLGDQYKVMGLASYGEPVYFDEMSDLLLRYKGGYSLNPAYFDWREDYRLSQRFYDKFGAARSAGDPVEKRHQDVAASMQKLFETLVGDLCDYLYEVTGCKNIGLVGGAALNCSANGRILTSGKYDDVFVLPCASDLGTCLGAAQHHAHAIMGEPNAFRLTSDYWGPAYDNDAILKVLERSGVRYRKSETVHADVADLLADGQIIGWFQGRMEFGPRALGARSILADPRSADVKDRINLTIKFREEFRPFAPMVQREAVQEYFGLNRDLPFMTFAVTASDKAAKEVPSVVHVDQTSRVQTVDESINPHLYALLSAFKDRTGVPVLLNTSFNLAGEPIVCSPEDALRTFVTCGMNALVMGDYIVEK